MARGRKKTVKPAKVAEIKEEILKTISPAKPEEVKIEAPAKPIKPLVKTTDGKVIPEVVDMNKLTFDQQFSLIMTSLPVDPKEIVGSKE